MTTGTLYVNSTAFSFNSTGWATVNFTYATLTEAVFNITGVNVNGETDIIN